MLLFMLISSIVLWMVDIFFCRMVWWFLRIDIGLVFLRIWKLVGVRFVIGLFLFVLMVK